MALTIADGTVLAVPQIGDRTRVCSRKTRHFLRNREEGRGWGVWGAGTGATGPAPQVSPFTVVPQNSSFCSGVFCRPRQRLTIRTPSPRLSSASSADVPFGLVVHPSMAVSTRHSWSRRPMMVWERGDRFFGSRVRCRPEWARSRLATWIHLTFRNLSCFHPARFSQFARRLRESVSRASNSTPSLSIL